ncbi:MAG: hypothetical protein ABH846_01530 [Patescibacteria group bacterium]
MEWLHIIWTENFQQFAADNLGRELTDIELNRLRWAFIEHDWHLADLMYSAGKDAMDNTKEQWDSIDENFKNGKPLFDNLICKEL